MKTAGRRSAAEATVVLGAFDKRPEPVDGLTKRQAEIWREVVASEDAKFFNTGALRNLLTDYCRHRETAEVLNAEIKLYKPTWLREPIKLARYQILLRMREVEVRTAANLATKLRLTNQSRYVPHVAARVAEKASKAEARPWEG
jgi:hypothetical protein